MRRASGGGLARTRPAGDEFRYFLPTSISSLLLYCLRTTPAPNRWRRGASDVLRVSITDPGVLLLLVRVVSAASINGAHRFRFGRSFAYVGGLMEMK